MEKKEQEKFTLTAKGHANVQATHSSTFEITIDSHLSRQGDCIIGVEASHSAQDINNILGDALRCPGSQIHTYLSVGEMSECIQGWGSPKLILSEATSLVWRTSDFVDARTVAIRCDKAAKDLNRVLIALLQNPDSSLQVTLIVFSGAS
ncbi:MAG: DUF371 domain-containing protein [Candidatus Odinarchaeota archaeon]